MYKWNTYLAELFCCCCLSSKWNNDIANLEWVVSSNLTKQASKEGDQASTKEIESRDVENQSQDLSSVAHEDEIVE